MGLRLNWLGLFIGVIFLFHKYWFFSSSLIFVKIKFFKSLSCEFSRFFSGGVMKKTIICFFVVLFFYILSINLLGLLPYVFSCSSHFVFTLSLGFPFWLRFIFIGWLKFTDSIFCHLVPSGAPLGLISLIVLIETVRLIIRPWSLRIRLMANMVSGHLLIRLSGRCGFILILVQVGLFLFEFFVCFIQAYVFSALLTLYSSEI